MTLGPAGRRVRAAGGGGDGGGVPDVGRRSRRGRRRHQPRRPLDDTSTTPRRRASAPSHARRAGQPESLAGLRVMELREQALATGATQEAVEAAVDANGALDAPQSSDWDGSCVLLWEADINRIARGGRRSPAGAPHTEHTARGPAGA